MIDKPKQYYDTRHHKLYYQWPQSEHNIHQEPIYDRTKEYIESLEAENARLRELCEEFARTIKNDDETFRRLREIAKEELNFDFIGSYDGSLGESDQLPRFVKRMRELGVKEPE